MTATLDSIDAKLLIAAPYLHDGCRRAEAVYCIDVLLDCRLALMLRPCEDTPAPA